MASASSYNSTLSFNSEETLKESLERFGICVLLPVYLSFNSEEALKERLERAASVSYQQYILSFNSEETVKESLERFGLSVLLRVHFVLSFRGDSEGETGEIREVGLSATAHLSCNSEEGSEGEAREVSLCVLLRIFIQMKAVKERLERLPSVISVLLFKKSAKRCRNV